MSFEVRTFRDGDEGALVELFHKVFRKRITEAHFRWKLRSSGCPVENVFVASTEGRPVFMYAGMPVRAVTPAGEGWAMVSVDTMTDPDFRRRGLLTEVGGQAYARWRAEGVHHAIGIGNTSWGTRLAALGWVPWERLRCLIRPIDLEALAARRARIAASAHGPGGAALDRGTVHVAAAAERAARAIGVGSKLHRAAWDVAAAAERAARAIGVGSKLHRAAWELAAPRDRSVRVTRLDRAAPELDALWARVAGDVEVSVKKDARWVDWRFFACPSTAYEVYTARRAGDLIGYAVFRTGGEIGHLAELVTAKHDEGAAAELVRAIVARAEEARVEKLQAVVPETRPLARLLRRAGLWYARETYVIQMMPLAVPTARVPPPRWRFTGADFDLE